MMILLAKRHEKNMKKHALSCSQIITERTNFLLPARQIQVSSPKYKMNKIH